VFGKYAFRVKANRILNNQFAYDPMKFSREQTITWGRVVGERYQASGKPVEAAILFMVMQMNLLSNEARDSEFVERTFDVIDQLKHQMTPTGRDVLHAWIAEFEAETARQYSETDHETFMPHYAAAA
jgi:hypothetical protein